MQEAPASGARDGKVYPFTCKGGRGISCSYWKDWKVYPTPTERIDGLVLLLAQWRRGISSPWYILIKRCLHFLKRMERYSYIYLVSCPGWKDVQVSPRISLSRWKNRGKVLSLHNERMYKSITMVSSSKLCLYCFHEEAESTITILHLSPPALLQHMNKKDTLIYTAS